MAVTNLTGTTWKLNSVIQPLNLLPTSPEIPTSGNRTYSRYYFNLDVTGTCTFTYGAGETYTYDITTLNSIYYSRAYNHYNSTHTQIGLNAGGLRSDGTTLPGILLYEERNDDYTYTFPNTVNISLRQSSPVVSNLSNITITGGSGATDSNIISWFEANATQVVSRKSIDLTTLPGWSSLSSGSHSITIVAKADGYRDSEPSTAVTVEKAAAIYKIPAGEYCIKYNLINGDTISNFPNESKDIIITDFKSYNGSWYTEQEFTFNKITTKISSDGTKELRYEYPTNQYTTVIKVNSSNAITYIYNYRSSVIFSIDVEVDKNTYDLFYTIYESIKVITPGTYKWVQNVELNFSAQMPLNFKSNGVNYSWFGVDNENSYYRLFYSTSSWGTPTVYDSSGWKLEAYKTFEVLSGCNIGRNSIAKQFINGKIAKQ